MMVCLGSSIADPLAGSISFLLGFGLTDAAAVVIEGDDLKLAKST